MSDVNVTVVGNVGTTPELMVSGTGTRWTSFRLASTRRVRNAQTGEWTDGDTMWFTVKLFRDKARHACMSLRTGVPVVVVGRLAYEEWEVDKVHELPDGTTVTLKEKRSQQVVEAQHVGVDATRGVVQYAKLAPERSDELERGVAVPDDPSSLVAQDPWAARAPQATDAEELDEAGEPEPVEA